MDFAQRAYDHSFRIDPIIRFLSDTDFYKLLMQQFIWRNFPNVNATIDLTNRTTIVLLADFIDIGELRAQLDYVKTLRWTNQEINFLKAQEFYGTRDLFCSGYIDYLQHSFQLSDYELSVTEDRQIKLSFPGKWLESTLWETYAIDIVNEMRYRKIMSTMSKLDLDLMYSTAKVKAHAKMVRLRDGCRDRGDDPSIGLNFTDFGTRRRHNYLWQLYMNKLAIDVLGSKFTGTSNIHIAMTLGIEAKGTNAHETQMAMAAMAHNDYELHAAPHKFTKMWETDYRGGLQVFLPDTYGTTQFLDGAGFSLRHWAGARIDSKDAYIGGDELIERWKTWGQDPTQKLIIWADGMDIRIDGFGLHGEDIIGVHNAFIDKVKVGAAMGTMFTNDFFECVPADPDLMKPLSLVCKVSEVNGRPAVKLSDNAAKRSGPPAEIERYVRVFGTAGVANIPCIV